MRIINHKLRKVIEEKMKFQRKQFKLNKNKKKFKIT